MGRRPNPTLDRYKARVRQDGEDAAERAAEAGMEREDRRARRCEPEFRHVYFIEAEGRGLVKIGHADDAKHRLRALQIGSPDNLILRGVIYCDKAMACEHRLHERFAPLRVRGEWFRLDAELDTFITGLAMAHGDDRVKLCFGPHVLEPGGVSVHRDVGESDDSFFDRVSRVYGALDFPKESPLRLAHVRTI